MMAAAAILKKKQKNHHISAAIPAILTKFGRLMHFDLLELFDR